MDHTDLYAYQLESRFIEVQKSGIEDVSYVEMRALSRAWSYHILSKATLHGLPVDLPHAGAPSHFHFIPDINHYSVPPSTYDDRVWKTGLPVRSAVLKPIIERGKFLKNLLPLKKRPYDFRRPLNAACQKKRCEKFHPLLGFDQGVNVILGVIRIINYSDQMIGLETYSPAAVGIPDSSTVVTLLNSLSLMSRCH